MFGLCARTSPVKQKVNPWLKWGCLTPVAVAFALFLGVYLLDTFMPSGAGRALPESATEVQEYYRDSWNGDYVRCLRAKLPEADFPLYAKNLGLTERFDPAAKSKPRNVPNWGFWCYATVCAIRLIRGALGYQPTCASRVLSRPQS
jgi:hypothetical protein